MTGKIVLLAGAAFACASAPVYAQETTLKTVPGAERPLPMQEKAALRCSAAFAMVAHGQKADDPATRDFPPVDVRGREFFVRTAARLMDERGLDRQQVAMLAREEAQALVDEGAMLDVMPGCLALLETSGL